MKQRHGPIKPSDIGTKRADRFVYKAAGPLLCRCDVEFVDQTSVFSASVSASSISTPRYRTVFSIFEWPSKIWIALRLPVALYMIDALVRRSEWVPNSSFRKPTAVTHSSPNRAYYLVLMCRIGSSRLGNSKSSTLPPRSSSQARRLARASVMSSN